MSAARAQRPPVRAGGRAPWKPSKRALTYTQMRKLGVYNQTRAQDLAEGDVILYENSSYCILKRDLAMAEVTLLLRELGSDVVRRSRFNRMSRFPRLSMPKLVDSEIGSWEMREGDVVVYRAHQPERAVLAIRHRSVWDRTRAPWTPLSDAEVMLDLRERRAAVMRSSSICIALDPRTPFQVGSIVATNYKLPGAPSVWLRTEFDYWVSNSRGAAISDQMVRYELRRGTYHFLSTSERLHR